MSHRAHWAWLYAAALAVGCQAVIGDIELPAETPAAVAALAGQWHVYGRVGDDYVTARVTFDDRGRLSDGFGVVDAPRVEADPEDERLVRVDLSPYAGTLRGAVEAEVGLGVLVDADGHAPSFIILVRPPGARPSLIGGRVVDVGDPGEYLQARLMPEDTRLYVETTEGEDEDQERAVAAVADDEGRWILRPTDEVEERLMTPFESGRRAVGILRRNGAPTGLTLLWADNPPPTPRPRTLFCGGVVPGDDAPVRRSLRGTIASGRLSWADGRSSTLVPTRGGALQLQADGGFFAELGGLLLPDAQHRTFALVPARVDAMGRTVLSTWGLGVCVALGANGPENMEDAGSPPVDAAPPDEGAPEPDAGVPKRDAWSQDALPADEGASEPDAA